MIVHKWAILFFYLILKITKSFSMDVCPFIKYESNVDNRPNLFIVTSVVPELCQIQDYEKSAVSLRVSSIKWGKVKSAPLDLKIIQGLVYDVHERTLYYLSSNLILKQGIKLNKLNLNDKTRNAIFDLTESPNLFDMNLQNSEIIDLAYDWVTKNVYMNFRQSIDVINLNNPQNIKKIVSDRSQILTLAVDPNKGYLFFVDASINYDNGPPYVSNAIYRVNLDGSNLIQIGETVEGDHAFINQLVIDYDTDRLYWSIAHKELIQHSKFDGTDVKNITGRRIYYGLVSDATRAMAIDKDYVYYRPANSTSIRRFKKSDSVEDVKFELVNTITVPIAEIVLYDSEMQKVRDDHPCKVANGGCERLCFAVPKENDQLIKICD